MSDTATAFLHSKSEPLTQVTRRYLESALEKEHIMRHEAGAAFLYTEEGETEALASFGRANTETAALSCLKCLSQAHYLWVTHLCMKCFCGSHWMLSITAKRKQKNVCFVVVMVGREGSRWHLLTLSRMPCHSWKKI